MYRIILCFVLGFSFYANAVFAQTPAFQSLSVQPSPALAHTPLRARSLFQFCRYGESMGKSSLSRTGNVLTLNITMIPQPGVVCFATPPPPVEVLIDVGSLEPGYYTLIQQPLSPNPEVVYPALQTQFSVSGTDSFSGLSVLPNPAFSGQALQARSTFHLCLRREQIASRQVTINGSLITLTLQMEPGAGICDIGVPPPPMPISFDIGALPAGNYTLVQQPVSSNPNNVYPALTSSFSVGAALVSVPAGSLLGNFALALLIGMGAALSFALWRD